MNRFDEVISAEVQILLCKCWNEPMQLSALEPVNVNIAADWLCCALTYHRYYNEAKL